MGRQPRQIKDGRWFYLLLAVVMNETRMVGIRTSIL